MFSFRTTPKRKASPLHAASRLRSFSPRADTGVCATCGEAALAAVCPVPGCAGASADPVRCLWQQNHLKAFELQPYSHSPEDLNEDEVVTLHVWFISTFAAV